MKIKTSELSGKALDYAVAKCEGVNAEAFHLYYEPIEPTDYDSHGYPEFHYSSIWAQGGPIIERENITLDYDFDGQGLSLWTVRKYTFDGTILYMGLGTTPLIAAMRCYVASKLGDEVEIPDVLPCTVSRAL